MELDPFLVEIFHDFSTLIIGGIVLLTSVVAFFVYKHFDNDLWSSDRYGD